MNIFTNISLCICTNFSRVYIYVLLGSTGKHIFTLLIILNCTLILLYYRFTISIYEFSFSHSLKLWCNHTLEICQSSGKKLFLPCLHLHLLEYCETEQHLHVSAKKCFTPQASAHIFYAYNFLLCGFIYSCSFVFSHY